VGVLTGCRVFAPPFMPPEAGGPTWVEITSKHFGLYSDLDPTDARAAVEELERTYVTLENIGFPYRAKPADRVRVVILRNAAEYEKIGPYGTAGFFTSSVWLGGEGPEPAAMFYGDLTEKMKTTLRHELTHRFVRFYYPKAPAWFNEGLAHYYETLTIEDGKVLIGKQSEISKRIRWQGPPPTMEALLEMEKSDVDPNPTDPDSRRKTHAHRAAAWAFVHLLKSGKPEYQAAFAALVGEMGKGADFTSAWNVAKLPLEANKFAADLAVSLADGREFFILKTEYTPPAPEIERERQLSPAEVHVLWAAIRHDPAEIATALRLDPDSPSALRTRAHLLESEGSFDAAERDLEQARALRPEDPLVLFDLFRLEAVRASAKGAPPVFRERAEALVPKLLPVASSAYANNLLALNLARWGRKEEAMPLVLRAIERDRSCWRCYETLAGLLVDRGDIKDAVKVQALALDLMPEATKSSVTDVSYRLLRNYRAAERTLLSEAVLRTILKRRGDAYKRCYQEGLGRDPKLEGQVMAYFILPSDGIPTKVADDGSTLPDKQVVACVLAEIGQLRFPSRASGAAQSVTYPLHFSPINADPAPAK
jgi:tetratricopeptide (TPR) repeat protein